MTTPPPLLASRMARMMTWTFLPSISRTTTGEVTEKDLGKPLLELSDQLDQLQFDKEEDTQAAVEEARRGKVRGP
jgi:hypothetical protein